MSSISTSSAADLGLTPSGDAQSLNLAAALPEPASVRKSFAYRNRMWLTAIPLIAGLVLTSQMKPWAELTLAARIGLAVLGWSCLIGGAAIRIWASTYICARKSVNVVRTGPYSLCRNPLYWGTFLMIAAFPLMTCSWPLGLAMLLPLALYQMAVIPVEESVMLSRHGAEYAAYRDSVSRWWPRFSAYDRGVALDGGSIGFRRECGRMVWWVGFALLAQLMAR